MMQRKEGSILAEYVTCYQQKVIDLPDKQVRILSCYWTRQFHVGESFIPSICRVSGVLWVS